MQLRFSHLTQLLPMVADLFHDVFSCYLGEKARIRQVKRRPMYSSCWVVVAKRGRREKAPKRHPSFQIRAVSLLQYEKAPWHKPATVTVLSAYNEDDMVDKKVVFIVLILWQRKIIKLNLHFVSSPALNFSQPFNRTLSPSNFRNRLKSSLPVSVKSISSC